MLLSGSRFRERLSITSTLLNGRNYANGATAVEVYYLGETQFHYLTNDPPNRLPRHMLHGQMRMLGFGLWNSMGDHISNTLVFLTTAKLVWKQVQEMLSGINNLRHTYDDHLTFFLS